MWKKNITFTDMRIFKHLFILAIAGMICVGTASYAAEKQKANTEQVLGNRPQELSVATVNNFVNTIELKGGMLSIGCLEAIEKNCAYKPIDYGSCKNHKISNRKNILASYKRRNYPLRCYR